ncbi:Similar to SLC24A5: Sodium/potassium/calcium exchanger 5 (Homo sapiens) [Cotesia congregata]|uniref:Sodium/potassium/calcium exchanger 5 n=1 Tax=Cotesia congregata TaxID=51543 RepID=A0A8J2H7P4_COTCN|nr:Similar to SLC24A5: Sodium/potassium/calcium exchanger 5 (Homo sapiens) [Cotesia congregata]
MTKRHKHLIFYRMLLVIGIPTVYFACISLSGFFKVKSTELDPEIFGKNEIRLRKLMQVEEPEVNRSNQCIAPAIDEFPSDGFTAEQRRSGFIVIHIVLAIYLFLLLAVVCDDFFVPSITKICEKLNVSEDVAGATFMAAASSSPELFINVVGTFVTQGDIGIGTIVGSAVFNILAVPACCGLFASQALELDWWPVSRDSLAYAITVGLLILVFRDGRVEWYEGLILVITYVLYILTMYFNKRISKCMGSMVSKRKEYKNLDNSSLLPKHFENGKVNSFEPIEDEDLEIVNLTNWPNSFWEKLWWMLTWPINFVLLITIPDCDTLEIPDSVMGLTFLAAGMSVPEAVSSVIVTNQGHGTMGISNSIGSNVFDILLCLGLPWFIKAAFVPKNPGLHYVQINSEGLVYSSISLFSTLILLYVAFACNKFRLDRKVGFTCLFMYACFLVIASLTELNVFFQVNLPTCVH